MTHSRVDRLRSKQSLRLVIGHEGAPIAFGYLIDVRVSLTSLANGVAAIVTTR
jgi:hypothetical protein